MALRSWWTCVRKIWSSPTRRTRRCWSVVGPALEYRIVLTVSAYEQLFLELINRARANPAAEAARFNINLNEGLAAGTLSTTAVQPLAFNNSLQTTIQSHLQDMINRDFFSHTGSNGSTVLSRINASGYSNWTTIGENLAYRASSGVLNTEAMVIQEHQDLFVDAGIAGRGHRLNILNPNFKETGAGVRTGNFNGLNAVFTGNDFGARTGSSFLTGVVISDQVAANNFYNVGEGLSGVSIVVKSGTTTVASTTSNEAGGYQIQVPAGTYQVTFSATGWTFPITKTFTIGTQNVKVDANTRTDFLAPPTVSFSATSYTVSEAGGSQLVTVSLSKAATTPIAVNYATSNGTAGSGTDYTATLGMLTFAPGETSKTFSIPITNDSLVEPTETIQLTLSSPAGATLGTQRTATVNITDNDVPTISFSQTAKSAAESTTSASFTVTLSSASTQSVTVRYGVAAGGTALLGSDFRLPTTSVTFAPGETRKTLTLNITNDLLNEALETIRLALSSTIATIGTGSTAQVSIVDNDPAPTVSFAASTSSGSEGTANPNTVRVVLSAPSGQRVTVRYGFTASGSTASSTADFTLPAGILTFEPGETVKIIPLVVKQDLIAESPELIRITLLSPTNSTLGSTLIHVFTILDDDLIT